MARTTNVITQGLSGMVGKQMVFRTWNGTTYISVAPRKPKKQSALQKENRSKFRRATGYAKAMMKDPVKKAQYKEIAQKMQLPNAYTAAITDYMRNPQLHEADVTDYAGKEGDKVRITARKKGFELQEIEVIVVDQDGVQIEAGKAIKVQGLYWEYTATSTQSGGRKAAHFLIRMKDNPGNWFERVVNVSKS